MVAEKKRYVSLAEVQSLLEKEREQRELTYEQNLALQHTQTFTKLSLTKTKKLIAEFTNIDFVSEENAYKIADMLPSHADDVKIIFAKERFTLESDQINEILDIVAKYL